MKYVIQKGIEMPYIKSEMRKELNKPLSPLLNYLNKRSLTSGAYNYIITRICQKWVETKTYEDYNRTIGVLESVKLEFYRRSMSLFEDKKIQENGDVYDIKE